MKPERLTYIAGGTHTPFIGKFHPDFIWKKHPDFGKRENPTLEEYIHRVVQEALDALGLRWEAQSGTSAPPPHGRHLSTPCGAVP